MPRRASNRWITVETVDRVTTHHNPIYIKHDIIHYAVANMPGAVARTSTLALTNATVPYAIKIANLRGDCTTISHDHILATGVNIAHGQVTHPAVAESLGYPYVAVRAVYE